MESFEIKQEIKEEPFDPDEFNSALIPKVEVGENVIPKVEVMNEKQNEESKSTNNTYHTCPKCDITYYSAMSIKNHIQVCKKTQEKYTEPLTYLPRITIKGRISKDRL